MPTVAVATAVRNTAHQEDAINTVHPGLRKLVDRQVEFCRALGASGASAARDAAKIARLLSEATDLCRSFEDTHTAEALTATVAEAGGDFGALLEDVIFYHDDLCSIWRTLEMYRGIAANLADTLGANLADPVDEPADRICPACGHDAEATSLPAPGITADADEDFEVGIDWDAS